MNYNPKLARLVELLLARTSARKIEWSTTGPSTSNWVEGWVADRIIKIENGFDDNMDPLEILTIRNTNGDVVERVDDTYFAGNTPSDTNHSTYWDLLKELRQRAYRQATGADDALDEIIEALEEDIPF